MKVREALGDALAVLGVDTVFALAGAANLALLSDLAARLGMRIVHGRHEAAVVSMADGFARFTGLPAVATVTAGPGLTNTATALAVARSHRSPVLLLAGDIPAQAVRHPQRLDQAAFARSLGCRTATARHARDLLPALRSAHAALAGGEPFVLNLPLDTQEADIPRPDPHAWTAPLHAWTAPLPPPATPLDGELNIAAEHLARARRVGILAGRGAADAHTGLLLRRLADSVPAVLATTLGANGLFTGHPCDAGMTGALGDGRAGSELAACDVLLAVGTSLHPLALPSPGGSTTVIRVDTAEPGPDVTADTDVLVRGDATAVVRRLLALLRGRTPETHGIPTPPHRPPGRRAADPRPYQDTLTTVDPRHALAELLPLLPPTCGIVIGGGHASVTACQMVPAPGLRSWTCPSTDFGAIGQSLAVALGACFSAPSRRIVHITGDGDLMMALGELHTAVRYHLPLTVIVLNDQGFGQERHQLGESTQRGLADHPSPDLAALATYALNAAGYRIDGPSDLHHLKQAMQHPHGLVLVDIRTTPGYRNPASTDIAQALATM